MQKPKERILEHLAVQTLSQKVTGPILCFTGPPGVGKTSLAKSVARACGREFVRLSLGGVRDEAEIRGHRRTYIGAMPGKIVQSMKKAGTVNPVFLLDEIDKLSSDFRGDPSSALLEVLDSEQNHTFNDHYLDLDYDLSKVIFIATSNSLSSIPWPLRDRMEIIKLDGYTEWEKLAIAKKYLIPKQRDKCGFSKDAVTFTEGAIKGIINYYTKEAGVRSLERSISSIMRKLALKTVRKKSAAKAPHRIKSNTLSQWLGKKRYNFEVRERGDTTGVVNGLAVTSFGGDLLVAEVSIVPGKGTLSLTGKLGEVMQESARIALSCVRSRSLAFGLDKEFHDKVDIHIHFPQGAIPKDGPSAGITIVTAIVSSLLKIPVHKDIAMTGEITLRGRVLKIGGLKEKIIAAHRSGIKRVIIPEANVVDLDEIPQKVLNKVLILPVKSVDEVLTHALNQESISDSITFSNTPIDWRT